MWENELKSLEEDGFATFRGLLDPVQALGPVFSEYQAVLDGIFETLAAQGIVMSTFHELDLSSRYCRLVEVSGRTFTEYFAPALLVTEPIHLDSPICIGPGLFDLITHPILLDAIEASIGSEISVNPGQKHRFKLPSQLIPSDSATLTSVGVVDWHQDVGAFAEESADTTMVTAWIPLTRATTENGCLQVIPGSHRQGSVAHKMDTRHSPIPQIDPATIDSSIAEILPAEVGDVILMRKGLVHASLPNNTESEVRMSLDLRYHVTGQPSGYGPFPELIVRSDVRETEILDYSDYRRRWYETRNEMAELGKSLLAIGSTERYATLAANR